LLTESVILALLGGVAGAIVGRTLASLIGAIQLPGDLPFRFDLSFDWRVFGYIAAIALAAGVGVGAAAGAARVAHQPERGAARGGRGTSEGGGTAARPQRTRGRAGRGVARLLVAAALFVRSVQKRGVDRPWASIRRTCSTLSVDVAQKGYVEAKGRRVLRRAAAARQGALPGVQSASLAYSVPLGYYNVNAYLEIEGQPPSTKALARLPGYNAVTPEYLDTMRPRLLKGTLRLGARRRARRKVAVISQMMAKRYWPDQEPIGKRFRSTDLENQWLEVVGVMQNPRCRASSAIRSRTSTCRSRSTTSRCARCSCEPPAIPPRSPRSSRARSRPRSGSAGVRRRHDWSG
jgi:hypothetical protein